MRRIKLFLLLLIIILTACKTTEKIVYKTKPLTVPPDPYFINNMNSARDLVYEYRRAIMKISEWQVWYDIQIETNHFQYQPPSFSTNTNAVEIKKILENETNFNSDS